MYAYEEKLKAINLYFKYKSYAAIINELGYPLRMALRNWVNEHKQHGNVKQEVIRRYKIHRETEISGSGPLFRVW